MNPFCNNDGHGLFALNKLYNFDMEIFGCQVVEEGHGAARPDVSASLAKGYFHTARRVHVREGRLTDLGSHSWSSFESSEIDGTFKKLKLCYGCDLRYRFEMIYKD
jgi:hypothetical protein